MLDLAKFELLIKKDLSEVLTFLWQNNLFVTLVGGAVRDYIIFEKLAHDLDFEIRSSDNLSEQDWQKKLNDVFDNWPFQSKIEKLPFGIFRLSYHGYDLEFSSPRRELFLKDRLDHKNFQPILFSNVSYIDSFSRRDFTINAIGIELKEDKLSFIDPYQGGADIELKKLRPISHDFQFDPVRFLRAIRFHFQLNFEFSTELISEMKLMNLNFLSAHYVKTEMLKTANSGAFWNKFRSLCFEWNIPVSEELSILFELESIDERILTLEDWVICCHLKRPLTSNQFKTIISFFQLSEIKLKSLLSFYDQALLVNRKDLMFLQTKSWQEALKDPTLIFLAQLKDNYLKLKNRDLILGLPKEQAQLITDLKFDQNRGSADLNEFLQFNKIPVTYTSLIRLYLHIKSLTL
jgi:tRNA nucleotidyltransferase (CCA-adding enzyme)